LLLKGLAEAEIWSSLISFTIRLAKIICQHVALKVQSDGHSFASYSQVFNTLDRTTDAAMVVH
jgi:hypothetical protein